MSNLHLILILFSICAVFSTLKEKSLPTTLFRQGERAGKESVHTVVIAIKQMNLDTLDTYLMEISTPNSPKFGKHLSRADVAAISGNPKATAAIEQYLANVGAEIIKKSKYGEYITAKAPISLWEDLFSTTFFTFHHIDGKIDPIFRALQYSIDDSIAEHVEAVFEVTQFPTIKAPKLPLIKKSDIMSGITDTVTPSKLNSYYGITTNTGSASASQGVFESLSQNYSPSDLLEFEALFGIPLYNVTTDIGGFDTDAECTSDPNNCAEANLDVQYMMAISQVTPMTYWYDGALDCFLDWILSVADSDNPPLVNSISYGSVETSVPRSIANQFNTEAMKLGVLGVSILVSSGDDGVAGSSARYSPSSCGYSPSFPATSAYVTSIGATQGAESDTTEIACSSSTGGVITTGGGFSTIFSSPSWQTDAVSSYFTSVSTTPVSGYVTDGRGYPDLALAGLNYEVVIGGEVYSVSGTSASSPTVAAMVSLVNAARIDAGKSPLGFLNPSIYEYGLEFANDITDGENNCTAGLVCCSEGFYAAVGWDPLTGFGSVNFAKFYEIFVNL